MKAEKVIVERTFNATAYQVWSAITDINEMKNWYFQLAEFEPKVGFKFDFMGGPENGKQYLHLCEVTEVIEGKKMNGSFHLSADGSAILNHSLSLIATKN